MKVSVIIPTYNRAGLLSLTVDSVLNQTYQDYEIIVIDDGSTDTTEALIQKKYSGKVKYIKQSNMGVNAARNNAINLAEGEYIALLDSDDLWLESKLELQLPILEHYDDFGFIFSDFYIMKNDTEKLPTGLQTWHFDEIEWDSIFDESIKYEDLDVKHSDSVDSQGFYIYTGDIYHQSLFGPYVLPSTAIVRREYINTDLCFTENDSTCGDWEFFAKLSHQHKCVYMDIETTLNRSHEDKVRLTRLNPITQTQRRIDLINRVWKRDEVFFNKHKKSVLEKEKDELIQLAKYQLLDTDIQSAKLTLKEIRGKGEWLFNIQTILLTLICIIPGTLAIIKFASRAKGFILKR